jgi:hypothetical protein
VIDRDRGAINGVAATSCFRLAFTLDLKDRTGVDGPAVLLTGS